MGCFDFTYADNGEISAVGAVTFIYHHKLPKKLICQTHCHLKTQIHTDDLASV